MTQLVLPKNKSLLVVELMVHDNVWYNQEEKAGSFLTIGFLP